MNSNAHGMEVEKKLNQTQINEKRNSFFGAITWNAQQRQLVSL